MRDRPVGVPIIGTIDVLEVNAAIGVPEACLSQRPGIEVDCDECISLFVFKEDEVLMLLDGFG